MAGEKVLVTGVSGFTGSAAARALTGSGCLFGIFLRKTSWLLMHEALAAGVEPIFSSVIIERGPGGKPGPGPEALQEVLAGVRGKGRLA